MPVGFDAHWIIRANVVNERRLIRQRDPYLLDAPFEVITSSDFVKIAGLNETDYAFPSLNLAGIRL